MFKLPLKPNFKLAFSGTGMLSTGMPALRSLAVVVVAGLALGGCTVIPQGPVESYPATYPSAGYPASPSYGSGYYGNGGYYGGGPAVGYYPPAVYVTPRVIRPAPVIVSPHSGYSTPRFGHPAPVIVPPRVVSPSAPAYVTRPSQPSVSPTPGYNPRNPSAPAPGFQGGGNRASPGASLPPSRSGRQTDRRH